MPKSQERLFEALSYGKDEKAKLTKKQYLVYSYLVSISKWDAQDRERHYYVYKNSFQVKDASKIVGITQPTWRGAIKKLEEEGYIQDFEKYYLIELPYAYAPLNIDLIKFLLSFGCVIKNGGNIVSVYSIIYRYWKYSKDNGQECEITINQLRKIFQTKRREDTSITYKVMLNLFEFYGLVKIQRVGREFAGAPYTGYIIKNVSLKPPVNLDLDSLAPSNIDDILKALEEKEE